MELDEYFMNLALVEAEKANNLVGSNPFVGAVVVKDKQVIATGFHQQYGGDHAEVIALRGAGENAAGSMLYITLEPCTHYGKTPPCVDQIIKSGVSRVAIGCLDPNPLVAGSSVEILKEHQIEVKVGVLEQQCVALNYDFFKYIRYQMPYVVLKSAMSIDGKIATKTGDSNGISGSLAWEYTQCLRNKTQAIVVSVNTVIADDPLLTCRTAGYSSPKRIIIDSCLRTPLDSKVVSSANTVPTIIATTISNHSLHQKYNQHGVEIMVVESSNQGVDLKALLQRLAKQGIKSILVEPGSNLANSFISQRLVDKLIVYIAPKIIGGSQMPLVGGAGCQLITDAIQFEQPVVQPLGDDILLTTYLKGEKDVHRNSRASK